MHARHDQSPLAGVSGRLALQKIWPSGMSWPRWRPARGGPHQDVGDSRTRINDNHAAWIAVGVAWDMMPASATTVTPVS
jgi:hypothetical protein